MIRVLYNIGEKNVASKGENACFNWIVSRLQKAGIQVYRVNNDDPNLSLPIPSGRKALGYTDGESLFLTENGCTVETTIHEYTHVWAEAMRILNPDAWKSVKTLLSGTLEWERVKSDEFYRYYASGDDETASEVLARITSANWKKKFEKVTEEGKLEDIAKASEEFWRWTGDDLLGIKSYGSTEEVSHRVIYDLLRSTDITAARNIPEYLLPEGISLHPDRERINIANPEIKKLNDKFNAALNDLKNGVLPDDYIFDLGRPSIFLKSVGFANVNILLRSNILREKSSSPKHPYNLEEIKDLVYAIQKPWIIFKYGESPRAKNIITGIRRGDKHFLVGVSILPRVREKYIEIDSVRNVFPRDDHQWIRWIQQGKALRIDEPQKVKAVIGKQGINHPAFADIDLNLVTKIVNNFVNPNIEEIEFDIDENIVFEPSPATRQINDALGVDGFIVMDEPTMLSCFDSMVTRHTTLDVKLETVLTRTECRLKNLPPNCAIVSVSGDVLNERFLIGPGMKLQEEYEDMKEEEIPYPFGRKLFYHTAKGRIGIDETEDGKQFYFVNRGNNLIKSDSFDRIIPFGSSDLGKDYGLGKKEELISVIDRSMNTLIENVKRIKIPDENGNCKMILSNGSTLMLNIPTGEIRINKNKTKESTIKGLHLK